MEASSIRRPLGALNSGTSEASTTSHVPHSTVQGCTKLNDEVYEVYKPVSGSFSLEVVFFHGFQRGGFEDAERRATGTWTTKDGSCWLNTWLVEHFPQARILAVSYDSATQVSESQGRMDMYLICENLVQSLIDLAGVGQSCPMVLVGHCIGGLVLKAVCVTCEVRSQKQFLENLRGVFFYSTPHSGSHLPVRESANGGGPLLEYFAALNKSSARINNDFSQLRHKYEWRTYGLFPANESRTSSLIHLTDEKFSSSQNRATTSAYISVVEEGSCRFDVDKFFTVSDVDHLTICNPLDPRSSNFLLLVRFLEEILTEEEHCNSEILQHLRLPPHLLVSEGRLDEVIHELDLENPKSVVLSLLGMDGIGKSTLAKQLLLHIRDHFDFLCFLEFEDIPKEPKGEDLENLVVKSLFRGRGRKVSVGNKAPWTLLRGKRVLVVADAVESEQQILPFLTYNWYGDGSRLVITTCVQGLISRYGCIEYAVPFMSRMEAEKLFKGVIGNSVLEMVRDIEELVSEVIAECEGLPLPLQILGCHLRKKLERVGPHPRKDLVAGVWRDALLRMTTANALDGMGGNQVWRKLKVIFDQLGAPEQTIFLDLATFDYYGPEKEQYDLNLLRTVWDTGLSRDMRPFVLSAILNLRDRCFLHCDCDNEDLVGPVRRIYIHPALRNMGRWISRQWSKGINVEDADDLRRFSEEGDNTTLETLSIMLEPTESSPNPWKPASVKRLASLRLLRLSHVNMREGLDVLSFPSSLAMLHMIRCSGPRQRSWGPFVRWHANWPIRKEEVECLRRLSVLLLDQCNLVRLPSNFQRLENLRVLRIEDESMTYLPEEFTLPRLEDFTLISPVENLPQSLLEMSRLRRMKLGSKVLKMWPTPRSAYPVHHLTSLVELHLVDLSALVELPDSFGGMKSLKKLDIERCSALTRLPSGFGGLEQLRYLKVKDCTGLEELCESFRDLGQLERLSLSGLPALRILPRNFGHSSLSNLEINKCDALEELPQCFLDFQSLAWASIRECRRLATLWQDSQQHNIFNQPKETGRLVQFWLDCPALRSLPDSLFKFLEQRGLPCEGRRNTTILIRRPGNLSFHYNRELVIGHLEDLFHLPECISEMKSLIRLEVEYCTNLRTLPLSVGELCALEELYISGCPSLMTLPESICQLTSLRTLVITTCQALITLPVSLGQLLSLKTLKVRDCPALVALPETLGQLPSCTTLEIRDCTALVALPETIGGLTELRSLSIAGCERLAHLPDSTRNLRSVEKLILSRCGVFSEFPFPCRRLKLRHLSLPAFEDSKTLLSVLQQVDGKELEDLEIDMSGVTITPAMLVCFREFTSLGSLRILAITNLGALFESLVDRRTLEMQSSKAGQLEHQEGLRKLMISDSDKLETLPEALGQLANLEVLSINWCANLRSLPASLGQLKSLKYLQIVGCEKLELLPNSVGQLRELGILRIGSCANLEVLPDSIRQLELELLRIYDCGNLKNLPQFLQGFPRDVQISTTDGSTRIENRRVGSFRYSRHPDYQHDYR